jgi:hypothetical protein
MTDQIQPSNYDALLEKEADFLTTATDETILALYTAARHGGDNEGENSGRARLTAMALRPSTSGKPLTPAQEREAFTAFALICWFDQTMQQWFGDDLGRSSVQP